MSNEVSYRQVSVFTARLLPNGVSLCSLPVGSNAGCVQGHDAHDHAHTHPMLPRFIEVVDFGNYELHTWYHSPLPPPFGTMRHLFVCPFTLKYFRKRKLLDAHISAIPTGDRHPPGYVQYTSPDPPPPEAANDDNLTITAVCDPKVRYWAH